MPPIGGMLKPNLIYSYYRRYSMVIITDAEGWVLEIIHVN